MLYIKTVVGRQGNELSAGGRMDLVSMFWAGLCHCAGKASMGRT